MEKRHPNTAILAILAILPGVTVKAMNNAG
jgi:hypothetical protein